MGEDKDGLEEKTKNTIHCSMVKHSDDEYSNFFSFGHILLVYTYKRYILF